MSTYNIKIPTFEGPFDLLLFFIERDELDIYDIPISQITEDFLAYIRQLEQLDIDVASEFILVAATLMRIKARLLIPRKELDQEGNELDPRAELTQKLLEYKRYKSVIEDFERLEETRSQKFERGYKGAEIIEVASQALSELEMESISLYKLLTTFNRLMDKLGSKKPRIVHKILQYDYSIEGQQEFIFSKIFFGKSTKFEELFDLVENKVEAIITFLALLELLNIQKIALIQGEGLNNFWLEIPQTNDSEEE
jgi:segregation and condensation protein A